MTGRSAANSVSRMTAILGTAFLLNCLLLSVVFKLENPNTSFIDTENEVNSLTVDTESGETTNPSASDLVAPESVTETPETGQTLPQDERAAGNKPENE